MYPQFLIIPAMMITIYCHTAKNNSDVIVTYSGHSEVENQALILSPSTEKPQTTTTIEPSTFFLSTERVKKVLTPKSSTPIYYDEDTQSVVFIPNEKPIHRNRDSEYLENDNGRLSVKDILSKNSISDILNDKRINIETEEPKKDILFISGKNNENENDNIFEEKKKQKSNKKQSSGRRSGNFQETKPLNCKHLDCNNTINSICGRKVEHKQSRYRLFMNECYFNKVNCNFKYAENRFEQVPIEKCKNVADHYSERPFIYKPQYYVLPESKPVKVPNYRRSSASRRSLNFDVDGNFCSHPCPSSCPEQYEPECAMSNKGVKKVFVNHCKLDFNSCFYGAVWHKRPLAECVGGRKADLTRNSAFIGWMQRVGIVDNKGRLKLE